MSEFGNVEVLQRLEYAPVRNLNLPNHSAVSLLGGSWVGLNRET